MSQELVVKPPSVLPYSYSSLTSFETCPWKHFKTKIEKSVLTQQYKQAADGIDVHKIAEDYINKTIDVVPGQYGPQIVTRVNELRLNNAPILAEKQLCITRDMQPCDWRAPDAYTRCVIDVLQVDGKTAYVEDWKTGKPDPFSTQLKHSSLLVLAHHPEVEVVKTRYIWLKPDYPTTGTVHRSFMRDDWNKFESRAAKLQEALEKNKWPAKKSGLCKQYCPVTTCEHNGSYQKAE